jgi:predicted enzyme related to lactoylglutathione lyase
MRETGKIDYIEYPARDLEATKRFFKQAFDWTFVDYGPEYIAFSDAGLDGGFYQSDAVASSGNGGALLVLFSTDLAATQAKIEQSGGRILKPVYSFPGGRRFHFVDPNGNEYAVWSDAGV